MLLIGRDLSPFVRRSATALNLAGISYERKEINTADDADFIRQHNPLGRVPALLLADEVNRDSHAIVAFIATNTAAVTSLIAASGAQRRNTLYHSSIALGCMEKAVASAYEATQKPVEFFHQPYQDRLRSQVIAGLEHLDQRLDQQWANANWFGGATPDLADVDAVVAYDFFHIIAPDVAAALHLPRLAKLAERANELQAFKATRWQAPISR